MRRVVITGLGIVSCLGNNQEEVYNSLLNSKSGISFAEEYKEHNLKSHVHGRPNIKLEDHKIFKPKSWKRNTKVCFRGYFLIELGFFIQLV